jgi:hypothetical protein
LSRSGEGAASEKCRATPKRSAKVPNLSKKNAWISKKSLGENILETSIFNALARIFPSAAPFFLAGGRKPRIVSAARRSILASTTDRPQRMRRESRNVQKMFL